MTINYNAEFKKLKSVIEANDIVIKRLRKLDPEAAEYFLVYATQLQIDVREYSEHIKPLRTPNGGVYD